MVKAYFIGEKPRIDVSKAPHMVEVVSSSKICTRCMIFCIERKPIFRSGQAAAYYRATGQFPETTVFCKNGCQDRFPDWGWRDFGDPQFEKRHIPWL